MRILQETNSGLNHDVCLNIIDSIVDSLGEIAKNAQYMLKNDFQRMPEALKKPVYEKICKLAQSSLVDCQYLN